MGFASIDALVAALSAGQRVDSIFQKTFANGATTAAGRWVESFVATGVPGAGTYSGTAGVATVLNKDSAGALFLNANVSSDTRHLLTVTGFTSSTTMVPATAILCDFLLYYPACVVTGTPTTLNNTATIPRYTTGDGCMAIISVQTALGAASPALTLNFDSNQNTGQTGVLTSPVNSAPVSQLFASSGQCFLPLPTGNLGVKKINSYTLASGTTGTVAFIIVKPLFTIPILQANVASERDLVMQLPSMPQVIDGACLGWLVQVGGAMTTNQTFAGNLVMGYD